MAQIVHLKEDSFLVTNPTTLHAMQCSAWVFPSFLYKVHKPATRVNAGARFQVLAPTQHQMRHHGKKENTKLFDLTLRIELVLCGDPFVFSFVWKFQRYCGERVDLVYFMSYKLGKQRIFYFLKINTVPIQYDFCNSTIPWGHKIRTIRGSPVVGSSMAAK